MCECRVLGMSWFLLTLIILLLAVSSFHPVKGDFNSEETEEQFLEKRLATRQLRRDPCERKRCSIGKECIVVDDEAKCQCISECSENLDERRRVCSNYNSTWQSDCHLFRHKCLCREGLSEECSSEHKKMKIDYYGSCQQLATCTEDILADFPRRMREWLSQIMRRRMERPMNEGASGVVSKWVNAVIWKFCDLDKSPHERSVSQDEVFPLRAPFAVYEPCITRFLGHNCDPDRDGKITLAEWAQCLSISPDEMDAQCGEFVKLST